MTFKSGNLKIRTNMVSSKLVFRILWVSVFRRNECRKWKNYIRFIVQSLRLFFKKKLLHYQYILGIERNYTTTIRNSTSKVFVIQSHVFYFILFFFAPLMLNDTDLQFTNAPPPHAWLLVFLAIRVRPHWIDPFPSLDLHDT